MPHLLSLSIMALALSLDGFGVGATYGLRRIRIPFPSVLIIALMSGFVFFVSMQIGARAAAFFSPGLAKMIGAVILMLIGGWAVYQMMNQEKEESGEQEQGKAGSSNGSGTASEYPVMSIELKWLGLVIQILKTPSAADLDRSGAISPKEAAWLGFALSLDAFGAGIGAALIGYPPVLTSFIIALSCGTFIWLGLRVGLIYSNTKWVQRLTVLPGIILILIGVLKLM